MRSMLALFFDMDVLWFMAYEQQPQKLFIQVQFNFNFLAFSPWSFINTA